MKKRVCFLVFALLIAVSGCGKSESSLNAGQDASEGTEINETGKDGEQTNTGVETDAADKETDAADAKQNTDTTADQGDHANGVADTKNALAEYALHLDGSNLDGVSFTYTKTADGMWQRSSLDESPFQVAGNLDFVIRDFDGDGSEELLTYDMEKVNGDWAITASIYEQKDGQVQKADTKTLLEKAFSFCDSGDVRFFLKDDKYICMDSGLSCFVIADGMQYAVKAYSYNGEKLVEMANEELQGSDFYEVGHSMTEYVDQLNTMGFSKTAAAVYDRDVLRVCAADSDITFLSKLLLHHSYLEEDKTWVYDPYAYMEFVEGEEAEDAYVLPESNTKELSADDLRDLGENRLRIARNEIYARYGRGFQDEALAQYFQKKAWYCQSENVEDTVLSETEIANRDLIQQAEQNAALEDRMLPEQYQPEYEKQDTEMEKNMEDLLNTTAYNGFLSRTYQNVKDAELGEIFYNGAGISDSTGASREELEAEYLKVSGLDEIDTDFMALPEQEMQALLQNETGFAMADFNHRIGWYYLPSYGAFAKEVSDTNFKQIDVQDVYYNKVADAYSVLYRTPGIMDEDGEEGLYRVTLKKTGENWQIIANTEI
ncbi:YARHG domain-containing protein [Kineothrix sp. MSJ-39]|uniref:YARHG domain-containing protein n=1 Tax=Kineothrix sp. MSJ-39 TaxID=2841533 RepID=UPI001C111D23|nr:YARHG domain-containing protein [Kineothrix sp. MSJ-39]MBU5429752.1 YARHG domain-containing protein [Kineothrix sp. MSJ-39]